MQFIDPKTDFAFQRIFGSVQHKAILLSFLNALLYQGQPVLADWDAITRRRPKISAMRHAFPDLWVRLPNGKPFVVEMQMLNYKSFKAGALQTAAKKHSARLSSLRYRERTEVVALTITDFVLFPEHDEVQSAYVITDRARLRPRRGDIELVIFELPKFTRPLAELRNVQEQWLFFLRQAASLTTVPAPLCATPEINQAFARAEAAQLSAEELAQQERELTELQKWQDAIDRRERAEHAEWLRYQEAVWRKEAAHEIALWLLPEKTDEQIADLTGLPLDDVAGLRAIPEQYRRKPFAV